MPPKLASVLAVGHHQLRALLLPELLSIRSTASTPFAIGAASPSSISNARTEKIREIALRTGSMDRPLHEQMAKVIEAKERRRGEPRVRPTYRMSTERLIR